MWIAGFSASCSIQNKTELESIHVLFYNYSFEPFLPVNCDDIKKSVSSMKIPTVYNEKGDSIGIWVDNHGVLDTIIIDSSTLKEIEEELKNLKPDSTNYSLDARISCVIKYKNGEKEQLCIGGYFANCIEYCGVNQIQSNKLLFLVKKNIGYYSWMGDHIVEYSDELHDKSFKRDSVIGYSGKKF
jgi:hypothetical protein